MTPKVLVFSNNCFAKTNSNGRTLGNFFVGWPKDCLAQFYIHNSIPDFEYCTNFFRVTDGQALQAFKGKKCGGGPVEMPLEAGDMKVKKAAVGSKKRTRNALTMMVRNLIWQSWIWTNCGFYQWVDSFAPDIILLQAGDCAFMYRLACKVAKRQNAKLVLFNTEGDCFKEYDYFKSTGIAKMIYPLFLKDLRSALKQAYGQASYVFYNCEELKRAYEKWFDTNTGVIYTSSNIPEREDYIAHDNLVTSYCGNLGHNRYRGLVEVAQILQDISSELYVDVYGEILNEETRIAFEECPGIRYHGFVSYEEVKRIFRESDLLLHVESMDEFARKDLRFGFSTKIADCLCSGTCFLLYAPEEIACARYLAENKAAYVASDSETLKQYLTEIVKNPDSRKQYLNNAHSLAEQNHRGNKYVYQFQDILKRL